MGQFYSDEVGQFYSGANIDGSVLTLPDPDLFVFMYVRKEAVLSSQIEGTQSSLQDLLAAEASLFDENLQRAERLRQSILSRAFSGGFAVSKAA